MAGGLSGLTRSLSGALTSLGQRPVVGLSIDGNDLRLVSVSRREVTRFLSRPLPPGILPGGVVADGEGFGAAVRTILKEYELPPATIVAGFPDTDAISKVITLPRDAGTKLAEVVQREARRDPVIGNGNYRVFFQKVRESDNQLTIFVLAVRRPALEQYLIGLKRAGIAPKMVELRPLAMIRAINQPHIIIANIEHNALDVVIVSNNLPVIMRSVPLAGSDTEIVDVAMQELERTIESYNSDRPHPLSPHLPVALTGELAALPEVQAAVPERVGHPILALTCPFAASPGFAVASFIVSIGLVLKAQ